MASDSSVIPPGSTPGSTSGTLPSDETVTEVDARHLACPLPLFMARKVLLRSPIGHCIRLRATAATTVRDLPDFCQDNGFTLLMSGEEADGYIFLIRREQAV